MFLVDVRQPLKFLRRQDANKCGKFRCFDAFHRHDGPNPWFFGILGLLHFEPVHNRVEFMRVLVRKSPGDWLCRIGGTTEPRLFFFQ